MSTLQNLIAPPPTTSKTTDPSSLSLHLNSIYESLSALIAMKNPSLIINSDFNTLGPNGTDPTTEADGNGAQFMGDWFVNGSSEAKYILTPTVYPNNSSVVTDSKHFVNVEVSDYSGSDLYFYQRQPTALRKYQQSYITFGLQAKNNGDKAISVLLRLVFFLDPQIINYTSGEIWLQPGLNKLTATIKTDSLDGKTVGNSNYAEWQIIFSDLDEGGCNLDISLYKSEYGKIHTSNIGSN